MPQNLSSDNTSPILHPQQLGIQDFTSYALVIDARSPREFAEDHLPGAINLPVVFDDEYAEVGTKHRSDQHAAYMVGVKYSLKNIAGHIETHIKDLSPGTPILVYCFRGGKRSRLWAENLRLIGFNAVDVLPGGWKNYRRWCLAGMSVLPPAFQWRVLSGPTGCGKTRLLGALAAEGAQVLDLEALAVHRGSLIGAHPDKDQPTQKLFDSQLIDTLRQFDPREPVWVEAESKKIGNVQIPEALHEAMHRSPHIRLTAPMEERVALWKEDYPNLAADPVGMVQRLEPIKPLIGGEELARWQALAAAGSVDELFERVMRCHYDPCYARSTRSNYQHLPSTEVHLPSIRPEALRVAALELIRRFGRDDGRGPVDVEADKGAAG